MGLLHTLSHTHINNFLNNQLIENLLQNLIKTTINEWSINLFCGQRLSAGLALAHGALNGGGELGLVFHLA